MKKIILISLLIIVCCTQVLAKERYVPNQLIIELAPETATIPLGTFSEDSYSAASSSSSIDNLNKKYKVKKTEKLFKDVKTSPSESYSINSGKKSVIPNLSNFYILEFSEGTDAKTILAHYKNDPTIKSASLNNEVETFITPNDPKFNNFPTYFNQWGMFKIDAEKAWNITTGNNEVIVAVLDTGVNYNHEDLAGKVILGRDYTTGDMDPMDDHGHGTHVAGIIGAIGNNSTGIAGLAWKSKILAIKVLESNGKGYDGSSAGAIVYAADSGADIINMSYGSFTSAPYVEAAVNYAHAKGCTLVAAAGNYGTGNNTYPAAYDHVIAVASTDLQDRRTSYTNFGTWVDICAPGGDPSFDPKSRILSTYHDYDSNYVWMMGTSMSAPFVSGTAALVLSMDPSLTPDEVEAQLKNTADDISVANPGYSQYLGAGRINAYRAANMHTLFSSLKSGGTISDIVPIEGTVTHESFDHYSIKWAQGIYPPDNTFSADGIILANDGKTPVEDGLLATWYTGDKFGTYTLKLSINDWSTLESEIILTVGDFKMLGQAENGPNPFNPLNENTKIKYVLSANTTVKLQIYDISATKIWSGTYPSGTTGGQTGTNIIEWDGTSKFGGIVANGVYLYKLSASGQQIGKGEIIVLK